MEILEFNEINPVVSRAKLKVKAEVMLEEFTKALREATEESQVKGFRKGTAPGELVERYVGTDEVWEVARDRAANEAFGQALMEKTSSCVLKPDFEHTEYEGDGDYVFTVTWHQEPPSPEEMKRMAQEDKKPETLKPEDHLPEHMRGDQAGKHQGMISTGPTFEHGRQRVDELKKKSKEFLTKESIQNNNLKRAGTNSKLPHKNDHSDI